MGEHAVVYGRPALAAAIDLRLTVQLAPLPAGGRAGTIVLDLPGLPHAETTSWSALRAHTRAARESWEAYFRDPNPERFHAVRGGDPAHLVKVALGEAAAALGEEAPASLSLRIVSALPVGSGFGSSAATATGVVAAYLRFRNTWGGEGLAQSGLVERIRSSGSSRRPSGASTASPPGSTAPRCSAAACSGRASWRPAAWRSSGSPSARPC
jgi:mevalonate kinase